MHSCISVVKVGGHIYTQPTLGACSRPSFFGGFVSTRKASALPTWQPAKPSESLAQSRSGQADKLKGRPSTQVKSAPAPPPDPVVLRKQQLKANRNFDSDSDTEPEKLKPRAYNQHLAQLEQKLSAAEKAAAAKRPAPKPQHVKQQLQQQQQQQQSAYKSPYNQALPKGSAQMRTIAPKGKAGAASRSMALAPQVTTFLTKDCSSLSACWLHVGKLSKFLPHLQQISVLCSCFSYAAAAAIHEHLPNY